MLVDLGVDPESMLELDREPGRYKARYLYRLTEHYTWVLITSYSTLLRSAVIRRWKDLELNFRIEAQKNSELAPPDNFNLACSILEREGSMADEWYEDKLDSYLRKRGLTVAKILG